MTAETVIAPTRVGPLETAPPKAREGLTWLRLAPWLAILVLAGPVIAGLAGTLLPAFGHFPVLGFHGPSLAPWRDLFDTPGLMRMGAMSLAHGLCATAMALGTVVLFTACWHGTRAFARLKRLLSPLLAVPHAAAAFGLAFLVAPSGMVSRLFSPWATGWDRPPDLLLLNDPNGLALLAGLVSKEVPFLFLVTLAALPQTNAGRAARLAASLGYGPVRGWLFTVFPLVYRQIRLAVFAVIAYSASTVDMAIVLGPTAPPTLAVRVVEWASDPDLMMRQVAAAGALLQFGVVMLAIAIWCAGEAAGRWWFRRALGAGARCRTITPAWRTLSLTAMSAAVLAVLGGIAGLIVWSLAGPWRFPDALPRSFTLRNWARALPDAWDASLTTLGLGVLASLIACALAVAVLENEGRRNASGRARDWGRTGLLLIYLPLLVPQVSMMLGLDMLFLTLGLGASFAALLLAHLVFVAPYVFLSLGEPWRSFDARYITAARLLGRTQTAAMWRVRLPMLMRAVGAAFALGFAVSAAQYLPTLLVGAGRYVTVTTEAVALSSGGNRRLIGVWALLQLLLPMLVFALALAVPGLLLRNRKGVA